MLHPTLDKGRADGRAGVVRVVAGQVVAVVLAVATRRVVRVRRILASVGADLEAAGERMLVR